MRVPGTRRSRTIILLSMVALTVLVGGLLYLRARALYRNLGPLVVAEIERQLGREVTIGGVDVHVPGRVVLDRVALAAGRHLSGGAMFRARRIVLSYSWLDVIWFRTDVVGSIRHIRIDDPFLLLVRNHAGRLNVQDLFKPRPGAPPTHFRAQVEVTRGRLLFQDYKAAFPRLPAENEVGNVEGSLDYRTFPRIGAQVTGVGRRGRAGLIRTTAFVDNARGSWLVRATAANADAAYWTGYFLRTFPARVQHGRGNVELVVSRTASRAPLEYVIDLAATGVEARIARLGAPIRGGRGIAQITPHGVNLEASGSLAGMSVQAAGNILDWKHPQVAVSLSGRGVTMAAARRAVPQLPPVPEFEVPAPGALQAWILGPVTQLYATGTLVLPAASWRGEPVRDAQVTWRFHAGMLQLDRVTAVAARGGRLTATGWAQLTPRPARLYLTGQLVEFNLGGLPGVSPRSKLGGKATAHFAVSGTTKDLHAAATVQFSQPTFNSARLNAATARLDYQDGVLYVRSLQAADPLGRLVAAGTVGQHGDLALQVRAKGIDLAALLAPFTKERASGTAYFSGSLEGTLREPRLAGQLQVYAGRLGTVSTDYAEGQVVVLPNQVQTDNMVLRIYPGQITARGTVGGWREGRSRLDLHLEASDLSVARLLAMAELKTRAAGTLSGSLTLQGSPAAPVLTASARVDDLLIEGTRLGTASAQVETDGRRLRLRRAAIDGDALAATAAGTIGLVAPVPPGLKPRSVHTKSSFADSAMTKPTKGGLGSRARGFNPGLRLITKESPLDLSFAVQRLDLARAASRSGARVLLAGIARTTEGTVRGNVGAPVVTAQVEASPLVVNGVTFSALSGSARYTRESVALRDVLLKEDGGTLRITDASLRPLPGKPLNGLSLDAKVEAFPVQRVIEIARRSTSVRTGQTSPTTTSGAQMVQGPVSGTITSRPEGNEPGAPSLWTTALAAPALTVPGYRLASEAGPAAPAQSQPLSVGLELRATYSTTGRLALERLSITRDEGVLLARGSMVREGGLDAQGRELPHGEIALRVDATDVPMGLFGPLAPALHPLRGTGELHLDASGPLSSPTIEGSLDVDKIALGGVPFTHFAIPFLQVVTPPGGGLGAIRIENARLEEDDKDHPSGQHYLVVDGSLPFQWRTNMSDVASGGLIPPQAPLSLTVRLPEQSLDVLNSLSKLNPASVNPRLAPALTLLGGLSAVSGTLSADLKVTGTRTQPAASGSFRIAGGTIQPQPGQTRFDQIAVRLGFTGNRIEVQQFHGRSSDGGTFDGSGDISGIALGVGDAAPAARFNLALALNDLRYRERNLTGYLQERFSGTLRTVQRDNPAQPAPVRLVGDWRTPTLDGAVQLRKARLALPTSFGQRQVSLFAPVPNPTLQLDVLLDRDVRLENPLLQMQLGGKLPIRGTLAAPSIHTTLMVDRGQMIFPTARFRLLGEIEVAYAAGEGVSGGTTPGTGGPAPLRVNLTATARVHGTDPNTGRRQPYDVTLSMRGPLTSEAYEPVTGLVSDTGPATERLTIEARSDPPLSQQQILALLGAQSSVEALLHGGGNAPDVLRREITDIATASVLPTLFNPLETRIEDWLGLEDFSVDYALGEPLQLSMTKKIHGPFFATYTRSLITNGLNTTSTVNATGLVSPLNLYTLEVYYKLSDRLHLGYRIEEPSHNRVFLLDTTFRF